MYRDDNEAIEKRSVKLGPFLYVLLLEYGKYYVRCTYTDRAGVEMAHGPFSEQEGNAFIDARVERHESLKRDIET